MQTANLLDSVQYVTDPQGVKKSVQLDIDVWLKLVQQTQPQAIVDRIYSQVEGKEEPQTRRELDMRREEAAFRNLHPSPKIDRYRELAKQVIQGHTRHKISYGKIEIQAVCDTKNDHYQIIHTGWHQRIRQYGCVIHIHLKNEKFWIQYDGTEIGVANELVELGVPNQDIVLAYLSPFARKHGDFAVA